MRASASLGANICEAASFILFFPLVLALLVCARNRPAFAGDPLLISLFAYLALLLAWNLLGFPEALARLSLFSKAPAYRTVIGFGVADMALVVALLGSPATVALPLATRLRRALFCAALLVPLLLLFRVMARKDPQLLGSGALAEVALLVCAQLAIGYLLASKRAAALLAIAALNVLSTGWFNPVVHGGFAAIWNNPLSQRIRELDAERGGRTAGSPSMISSSGSSRPCWGHDRSRAPSSIRSRSSGAFSIRSDVRRPPTIASRTSRFS